MSLIAALSMYDWPERRAEVDAEWATIRDALRERGVEAPDELTRGMDEQELWRHPSLLFGQTCWGPMELGLAEHVQVIGQPSYDGIDGGGGEFYSSAIVMRAGGPTSPSRGEVAPRSGAGGGGESDRDDVHPTPAQSADLPGRADGLARPADPPLGEGKGGAFIPLDLLRHARFAYNGPNSMSGIIGLTRDLEALGESLDIFADRIESGGHRNSIKAVAEGRADVAAIDCMSWHLARLYEPAAQNVQVVGWTAKRKGLPFITAITTTPAVLVALRQAVESITG
ncbi:MAG: PhnD/SsuA/transferrin family substrate-binding protein [Rhizobiaceae bacterium]